MKRVDYMAVAHKAMAQIKKGAFLTVKSGKAINTMTIGWANIGHVWRKPIMTNAKSYINLPWIRPTLIKIMIQHFIRKKITTHCITGKLLIATKLINMS